MILDIAIKAGFSFTYLDEGEDEYLETLSGEHVKVPEEKL